MHRLLFEASLILCLGTSLLGGTAPADEAAAGDAPCLAGSCARRVGPSDLHPLHGDTDYAEVELLHMRVEGGAGVGGARPARQPALDADQQPQGSIAENFNMGKLWQVPPPSAPTDAMKTTVHLRSGAKVTGLAAGGVRYFYDIQYASAKRFGRPTLQRTQRGQHIDATEPKNTVCFQQNFSTANFIGSEDCLFLDVYAPAAARLHPHAVMVYIHGGALTFGSKYAGSFADFFVQEGDVVVVTINYRLNVFGFWTDSRARTPKNFGLRDQIAALKWVRENIAAFGGDRNSVTIFGNSAGGLSVTALLQSPKAKGLFHKAIAQSPGFQTPGQFGAPSRLAAASLGATCLMELGCDSVECLRQKNTSQFTVCTDYFGVNFLVDDGLYFAGYDGQVLPASIDQSVCPGRRPVSNEEVPLLIGAAAHEWRIFSLAIPTEDVLKTFLSQRLRGYGEASPKVQECARSRLLSLYANATPGDCCGFYSQEQAQLVQLAGDLSFTRGAALWGSSLRGPRYVYVFDTEEAGGPLGATHSVELCYFFPEPNKSRGPLLPCQDLFPDLQAETGRLLRGYWYSFAKQGKPTSTSTDPAVEEWVRTGSDCSSDGLGTPVLRIQVGGRAELRSSPWFNRDAAAALRGIVCGDITLRGHADHTCELVDSGRSARKWQRQCKAKKW
eukprot:CAMPEP_0115521164 /NCGR_PEP_ID=MMETSP0271-20121206/79395_1 /TAXON_ID=71861 /ORGANISM="Scrippsiella trochoidea, Strain CCMP3099" /LENGTH=669 /DNA_ID=CAMNT_0002952367 /DNA_START=32 /DNA_END=2038 /DNA_ORIENTATION=-